MAAHSPRETLAGRYYFLQSVAKVNPEVLESLSQDVWPHFVKKLIPRVEAMAQGIEQLICDLALSNQLEAYVKYARDQLIQLASEAQMTLEGPRDSRVYENLAIISPSAAAWWAIYRRPLVGGPPAARKARVDAGLKLALLGLKYANIEVEPLDVDTREALLKWENRFNLVQPWITEVALDTLMDHAGRRCDRWKIPKAEAAARVSCFLRKNSRFEVKIRKARSDLDEVRSEVRSLMNELESLDRQLDRLSRYASLVTNQEIPLPEPPWCYLALAMFQTNKLSPRSIQQRLASELKITTTEHGVMAAYRRTADKIGLKLRHRIRRLRSKK